MSNKTLSEAYLSSVLRKFLSEVKGTSVHLCLGSHPAAVLCVLIGCDSTKVARAKTTNFPCKRGALPGCCSCGLLLEPDATSDSTHLVCCESERWPFACCCALKYRDSFEAKLLAQVLLRILWMATSGCFVTDSSMIFFLEKLSFTAQEMLGNQPWKLSILVRDISAYPLRPRTSTYVFPRITPTLICWSGSPETSSLILHIWFNCLHIPVCLSVCLSAPVSVSGHARHNTSTNATHCLTSRFWVSTSSIRCVKIEIIKVSERANWWRRRAEVLHPCTVKEYVMEVCVGTACFWNACGGFSHECDVPGRPSGTCECDPSVRLEFLGRTLQLLYCLLNNSIVTMQVFHTGLKQWGDFMSKTP